MAQTAPEDGQEKKFKGRLVGKDMWDWDPESKQWIGYIETQKRKQANLDALASGQGTIGTDNVACFLARAGYAAVVPGTHDFYFGPERLRQLARFMASLNQAGYEKVQMLGANLAIKTFWANDHKPVPDQLKPHLKFLARYIGKDPNHNVRIQSFTENGFVYPWMHTVKIEIEPPRAEWDGGEETFEPPILCQVGKIQNTGPKCKASITTLPSPP